MGFINDKRNDTNCLQTLTRQANTSVPIQTWDIDGNIYLLNKLIVSCFKMQTFKVEKNAKWV